MLPFTNTLSQFYYFNTCSVFSILFPYLLFQIPKYYLVADHVRERGVDPADLPPAAEPGGVPEPDLLVLPVRGLPGSGQPGYRQGRPHQGRQRAGLRTRNPEAARPLRRMQGEGGHEIRCKINFVKSF